MVSAQGLPAVPCILHSRGARGVFERLINAFRASGLEGYRYSYFNDNRHTLCSCDKGQSQPAQQPSQVPCCPEAQAPVAQTDSSDSVAGAHPHQPAQVELSDLLAGSCRIHEEQASGHALAQGMDTTPSCSQPSSAPAPAALSAKQEAALQACTADLARLLRLTIQSGPDSDAATDMDTDTGADMGMHASARVAVFERLPSLLTAAMSLPSVKPLSPGQQESASSKAARWAERKAAREQQAAAHRARMLRKMQARMHKLAQGKSKKQRQRYSSKPHFEKPVPSPVQAWYKAPQLRWPPLWAQLRIASHQLSPAAAAAAAPCRAHEHEAAVARMYQRLRKEGMTSAAAAAHFYDEDLDMEMEALATRFNKVMARRRHAAAEAAQHGLTRHAVGRQGGAERRAQRTKTGGSGSSINNSHKSASSGYKIKHGGCRVQCGPSPFYQQNPHMWAYT